jgi:NADH-quinone oxidoreductase subunit E
VLGMLKALRTTVRHLPQKPFTIQYPEERAVLPARSRGLFKVVVDVPTGEARCRACTLCETNCPVQVIRVNHRSTYALPAVNEARIVKARMAAQPPVDLTLIEPILGLYRGHGIGMIAILQHVQELYEYLPRAALEKVSLETGISLSQIYGVASFYNMFRLSPVGKHRIAVCTGTACHVAGAPLILEAFQEVLGIEVGKTTKDQLFTVEAVNCVGACALAPVVRVGDDETHGRMTPDLARKLIADLRAREGAA